jgi:BirA family biotin operon repressor/biotin-[acetyl-CoA-carboxylase] ligase
MDACADAARRGAPDGHVVLARSQSAGRGRVGRRWSSPPGAGLYLSRLVRGFPDPAAASGLTLAAGVALHETARRLGIPEPDLKWPNDVLVRERKLAGLLAEWVPLDAPAGAVVLGVGLNLARTPLPPDLLAIATSVEAETGTAPDPEAALELVLERLDEALALFRREGTAAVARDWAARSLGWGRSAEVDGIRGTREGLDPDGALRLRLDDGTIVRIDR